ncbi:hypothetical protein LX32DRAFT_379520 [Colletotrichum zoysiae]|uniref:Condensation domain-containing protein n=1 Tax=Colletotrichum zoysiae TaxID=1216348 RepID=A0AAD9HJK5_9PEZI|nr:hypothetical protein LX32DRAFT_379520 [Colletotrichum zoysiae]
MLGNELASEPTLPPTTRFPLFVSDSIADKYLPSHVSTQAGELIMSVDKFNSLATIPNSNVLVCMERWRGSTSLSITFDAESLDRHLASKFLNEMRSIMLGVLLYPVTVVAE